MDRTVVDVNKLRILEQMTFLTRGAAHQINFYINMMDSIGNYLNAPTTSNLEILQQQYETCVKQHESTQELLHYVNQHIEAYKQVTKKPHKEPTQVAPIENKPLSKNVYQFPKGRVDKT